MRKASKTVKYAENYFDMNITFLFVNNASRLRSNQLQCTGSKLAQSLVSTSASKRVSAVNFCAKSAESNLPRNLCIKFSSGFIS